MSKYDNSGKGALWSNQHWSDGSKAPKWTGKLVADRDIRAGDEIPLAVWVAERKSEQSPVMRLRIDRFEKGEKKAAEPAPVPESDFDDKIPF